MNAEETDNFLKNTLKAHGLMPPPSLDYTHQVMQRVSRLPVPVRRKPTALVVAGLFAALLVVVAVGAYVLIHYGQAIQHAVMAVVAFLPFAISWKMLVFGMIYLLLARVLLTVGILALIRKMTMPV